MDLSTAHAAARAEAARLPALQASLDLLNAAPGPAAILLYAGTRPAPGAAPAGALLAAVPMAATAGTIDTGNVRIVLTVPIEAQAVEGGDPVWARIFDGAGAWWADASVSATGGGGEIELDSATLYAGGIVRLTSAILQG